MTIDLNKEYPVGDIKLPEQTPEQKAAVTEIYKKTIQEIAQETPVSPEDASTSKTIAYDDFAKVKLLAGTVLSAERVPNSDKLLNLSVDLGEPTPRQIIAGIGLTITHGKEGYLVGKQFVFVANLAPRQFKIKKLSLESNGMILATGEPNKLSFVQLTGDVPNGSQLG